MGLISLGVLGSYVSSLTGFMPLVCYGCYSVMSLIQLNTGLISVV